MLSRQQKGGEKISITGVYKDLFCAKFGTHPWTKKEVPSVKNRLLIVIL